MKRCAIVDDEPLAVDLLSSYVEQMDNLQLAGSFTNPIEFLQFEKTNKVDVVFLDINMPELSGTQVAKLVDENCKIIFTTAYSNYAVEGFELEAIDYLVKPITFGRFEKAVKRLFQQQPPANEQHAPEQTDAIFIKVEHRLQRVNLTDILYLKGMGDYVQVVTTQAKYMTLENMKSFQEDLPKSLFQRVHKSYIVAISKIDYIRNGKITIGETKVPIGKTYEDEFYKRIG